MFYDHKQKPIKINNDQLKQKTVLKQNLKWNKKTLTNLMFSNTRSQGIYTGFRRL